MSNEADLTTNDVIDWFQYYNIPFLRVNKTTKITLPNFKIANSEIDFTLIIHNPEVEPITIKFSDISGFWYRRGDLNLEPETSLANNKKEETGLINKAVSFYLDMEKGVIKTALLNLLIKKKSIGNFFHSDTNKLEDLIIAKEVGLDIPNSIVASDEKVFEDFSDQNEKLITKPLCNVRPQFLNNSDESYTLGRYSFGAPTSSISKEDIEQYDMSGFPSYIQEEIEKAFELRVFYLHGDIYSVAIFSQNDEQTKLDFRNYNVERPNRTPPFNLPDHIEAKVKAFMEHKNHNSGSIDLIYTKDKRYIFLELNPIGQFHQVSHPGNYYLERTIAKYFL